MSGFSRRSERLIYEGAIWNLVVATFEAPTGEVFQRDLVRSPGSVAVVALVEGSKVVLVRQYRPAFEREIIEIPAGMRDIAGEPVAETARRELVEEVGLATDDLIPLTEMIPSVGMTDAVCTIFLAPDCRAVPSNRQGPEEEAMEIITVELSEAIAMVDRGEITDAKTVTGLLLADRVRRRDR